MCNIFLDKLEHASVPRGANCLAHMCLAQCRIISLGQCTQDIHSAMWDSFLAFWLCTRTDGSVLVNIVLLGGDPVIFRKLKQRNAQLLSGSTSGSMDRVAFHKRQGYLGFCHLTSFPSAFPSHDLILLGAFLLFLNFQMFSGKTEFRYHKVRFL